MNLKKQKEMQENMDFVRQHLSGEATLPPALQGQYLLQKANMQKEEYKAPILWKKWAAAACSLVLVAMLGLSVLPQSRENQMAPKAMPMAYSAAPAECALEDSVEDSAAMGQDVSIKIHTAKGEDALAVLKERYPGVQIYSFDDRAESYTVFLFHGEESHSLAFLGATIGYDFIEDALVISEVESGKVMKFDPQSFQLLSE